MFDKKAIKLNVCRKCGESKDGSNLSSSKKWQQRIKPCCHDAQPVPVGDYTIYVTAYKNLGDRDTGFRPDIGVYFDTNWDKLFKLPNIYGLINGFGNYPGNFNYPALILDWGDWNGIDNHVMEWLFNGVVDNLERGKKVDIGCYGGHGRTGTFLACLMGKLEKLDARESILTVRKRYCEQAVESDAQIETTAKFLKSEIPKGLSTILWVQDKETGTWQKLWGI